MNGLDLFDPSSSRSRANQRRGATHRRFPAGHGCRSRPWNFPKTLPPHSGHFKLGHSNFVEVARNHRCWKGSLCDLGGFSAPKPVPRSSDRMLLTAVRVAEF